MATAVIFWLMHRLSGEVRREFGYSDDRRWVEKYGLLKTTFYVEDPKAIPEDGAYTGTRDYLSVSERPGISPAIAGCRLSYFTFSSLNDDRAAAARIFGRDRAAGADRRDAGADERGRWSSRMKPRLFKWAMARKQEEDGKARSVSGSTPR